MSSNEVKRLVVVFIPLQLTMCRVIEHRGDHVRLMYDLPDGTPLTQKIVVSSILPITKILVIEDHKLDDTFLHIALGSQSLLKSISDQIRFDTN
jgi:hypothetical protein